MMNKEAAKSFLGWESINNAILIAYFMTKKFRVSGYNFTESMGDYIFILYF